MCPDLKQIYLNRLKIAKIQLRSEKYNKIDGLPIDYAKVKLIEDEIKNCKEVLTNIFGIQS